jgi:hypothetical protein
VAAFAPAWRRIARADLVDDRPRLCHPLHDSAFRRRRSAPAPGGRHVVLCAAARRHDRPDDCNHNDRVVSRARPCRPRAPVHALGEADEGLG